VIKKEDKMLCITAIGINQELVDRLKTDFPFMDRLFDRCITSGQYISLPFLKNKNTLSSSLILIYMRLFGTLDYTMCQGFDLLLLPQPKPILKHPQTEVITVFHDIFGIIDNSTMNIRQRIIEHPFVYRTLAKNSYKLFANSMSTAFDLVNLLKVDEKNIRLVYPALPIWDKIKRTRKKEVINSDTFKKQLPKKFMLAVSGIEPRKNWVNTLLAFNKVQKDNPAFDYYLIFAGRVVNKSYYKLLLKTIEENQINRVLFFIDISETQKKVLYHNCDFVLYPSFYEGFGFPILESYEAKKPIITSKVSSMPELARESAVYVNPLNYFEIEAAIRILTEDRTFYTSLVSNIDKNKEEYSWIELESALRKLVVVDESI
jgi:glycosyltransferase involved in cell wall biosynthesis